mmetsp:Transcript_31547/g.66046  ORF Transcript_31547/g.66046 Transcript_31547/m.66046 type:complete len:256 (+) Transcript_31547:158-925(+)
MKLFLSAALVTGACAFTAPNAVRVSTALNQKLGSGGMADTRDPEAFADEDPRKSISAAPSFEEYLKQRDAGASSAEIAAPAAAAPAAAAPAAASGGGGGDILGTVKDLQGPGQVWGDLGIAEGFEENDLKGYENFGKFAAALESTGVAAELGAGPYTVFAPTDPTLESYETLRGEITADIVKMHIVPGKIASADIPTANLESLAGPLVYRYAVRKHFVNDAIIGEKTFGPYDDYPMDVECSNGIIHSVGLCFGFY